MKEEELWNLSDEELETAFKAAQAEENSPETNIETVEEDNDSAEEEEEFEETYDDEGNLVTSESDVDEDTDEDNLEEETESDDSSEESTEEVKEEDKPSDESEKTSDNKEDGSEKTDKEKDEEQPAQSYKFKANGKDYDFSTDEIVDQFPKIFGQAMDYTKKMQAIKPWRKTIDAIEGAKLNHDDVSLMIDVLKGDKTAITEVLKRTGVNTLDIDTDEDSNYVAKNYGRDEKSLAIKDIVETISKDAEYATTQNILAKEWDEASWNVMTESPDMIRLLHEDVKSGVYKTLQPTLEKLKVFDGGKKTDIEYYKEAAKEYFNKEARTESFAKLKYDRESKNKADLEKLTEVKAASQKRTNIEKASVKRKAAAPSKAAATSRGVVDYLESSDEDFDEWYKNLQDNI